MRASPAAHRAFEVISPIRLYRLIGRRPSNVYVDDNRQPSGDVHGHRLWDLVFEEHDASPGDQIQDRPGGIVLVTRAGEAYPVQLTPPAARSPDTAFVHADMVLAADRRLAEEMLKEGRLATGAVRRIKAPVCSLPKTLFDENHPLVSVA